MTLHFQLYPRVKIPIRRDKSTVIITWHKLMELNELHLTNQEEGLMCLHSAPNSLIWLHEKV